MFQVPDHGICYLCLFSHETSTFYNASCTDCSIQYRSILDYRYNNFSLHNGKFWNGLLIDKTFCRNTSFNYCLIHKYSSQIDEICLFLLYFRLPNHVLTGLFALLIAYILCYQGNLPCPHLLPFSAQSSNELPLSYTSVVGQSRWTLLPHTVF